MCGEHEEESGVDSSDSVVTGADEGAGAGAVRVQGCVQVRVHWGCNGAGTGAGKGAVAARMWMRVW